MNQITDDVIQQIVQSLNFTLHPDHCKQAEEALRRQETAPGFSLCLLKILSEPKFPGEIKMACSCFFKNFIRRNWVPDDISTTTINDNDRMAIKQNIVSIMLASSTTIQKQLSESLSYISASDFPEKWNTLLPELVAKMNTSDNKVLIGVLETANSIFHCYRHEFKCDELLVHIKYVLVNFATPLLSVLKKACESIEQNCNNKDILTQIFTVIRLCCRIFLSLNTQDIPQEFEDSLDDWMNTFILIIKYYNNILQPDDNEVPGILERVKAAICENLSLYVNHYEEEFNKYVSPFVTEVWNLLTRLDEKDCYNELVVQGIRFLNSVVTKKWHMQLFSNEDTLKQISEKIIIPNIKLRESDIYVFESNPLEFVRYDIEGSDSDTRRRITIDFVQGLCVYFEAQITSILFQYITRLLQEYQKAPDINWMKKDAAIYLVLALTIKGSTESKGTTKVNPFLNIIDFYTSQIIPELQDPNVQNRSVLRAACLKFLMSFRQQLPKEQYLILIELLNRHLSAQAFVVHTYSAITLEKLLSLKEEDNVTNRIQYSLIQPHLETLFTNLFNVLTYEESTENQYIMKTILRILLIAKDNLELYSLPIIQKLGNIVEIISKNPKNAYFNHYVFESLSVLLKYTCLNNKQNKTNSIDNYENMLFQPLVKLTETDLAPYAIQILNLLLNLGQQGTKNISKRFLDILPQILAPGLWLNVGNIPAMASLINTFIAVSPDLLTRDKNLELVLGIFQKLIASRSNDKYGLSIIQCLLQTVPISAIQMYLSPILTILFGRLQKSPSISFTSNLLSLFGFIAYKHGIQILISSCENVQQGIFFMILKGVWIPKLHTIIGITCRKNACIGLSKLLIECTDLAQDENLWVSGLSSLVRTLDTRESDSTSLEYESYKSLEDEGGYTGSSYSRLVHAVSPPRDPLAEIINYQKVISRSIIELITNQQAKFQPLFNRLPEKERNSLQKFSSS